MRFNTPAINSNILTPRIWCLSHDTISGLHTASFHFSRQNLELLSEIPLWTMLTLQLSMEQCFLRYPGLMFQGNISNLPCSSGVAERPLLVLCGIKFLHSPTSWYWFIIALSHSFLLWIFASFSLPWSKNNLLISVITQIAKTSEPSPHNSSLLTRKNRYDFYVNILSFDYKWFSHLRYVISDYRHYINKDFLISMCSSI